MKIKIVFKILFSLLIILLINNAAFAGPAESLTFTCGSGTPTSNWPRNTFSYSCSISASKLKTDTTYDIGVYTGSYTTSKTGGNGSDITYTSPEHRLKVDGPDQGGTFENVTTNSSQATITMIKSGITGVTSYSDTLTFTYVTYEADFGDTDYSQSVTAILFGPASGNKSDNDNLTFTIEDRYLIVASASPSVTLTPSDVYTADQDFDSNTFTFTITANNTWLLETQISDLDSASDTIQESSNYFRATGTGFNNLAASKTNFVRSNTYYDIAENSSGVYTTGTSNNISLNSLYVAVIYNLRTTDFFSKGIYTTTAYFNLNTP